MGVPKFLIVASFPSTGNDTTFAGGVLGTLTVPVTRTTNDTYNYRQIMYSNELFDLNGDFDATTSTFTVPYTGIYNISANLTLKMNSAVTKVAGQTPSSTVLGAIRYSRTLASVSYANFLTINQVINPVVNVAYPFTNNTKGLVQLNAGDKITIVSLNVNPGTSGLTYSADTSSLGINREDANQLTISYFPVQ